MVHAHGLRAGALSVLAARSVRRVGPAVVVTLHNLPVGGRGGARDAGALERVVAPGADVVLGVSGDLVGARGSPRRTAHRRGRPRAGPAPAGRRPRSGPARPRARRRGAALVVTVARLAPQKGLDLLCDTAALLRDTRAALGRGGRRAARERDLAQRADVEHLPVEVLGRRDDVPDLMAAADVVVSTALWEGQPLGIQEALALGAAVVATDVGGTREVTGDAAVLVRAEAEALADAVRAAARRPRARRRPARRGPRQGGRAPGPATHTLDQLAAGVDGRRLRRVPRRPAPKTSR